MGIICSWLWVHNSPIIYWESLLVCKSSWDICTEMQNSFLLVTHQICTQSIFPLIRYYIDFCLWSRETCNALLCEGTKGEGTKVWIFMFSVLLVKAQRHVIVHYNTFFSCLSDASFAFQVNSFAAGSLLFCKIVKLGRLAVLNRHGQIVVGQGGTILH